MHPDVVIGRYASNGLKEYMGQRKQKVVEVEVEEPVS